MPDVLRMRVFAGPNGSGKSTMYEQVRSTKVNGRLVDLGVYVNPDEIAKSLRIDGGVDLKWFKLKEGEKRFRAYAKRSTLINDRFDLLSVLSSCSWTGSVVRTNAAGANDAFAQLLTQFICDELLRLRMKFSFETVFSHRSKLEMMQRATKLGYKVYLYFIATNDPEINKDRVKTRVAKGGHDVPPDRIESRYYRSLELLPDAIRSSYHAFMFDNSGPAEDRVMFAEYKVHKAGPFWHLHWADVPEWFIEHYMKKSGSHDIIQAIEVVRGAREVGFGKNPDR